MKKIKTKYQSVTCMNKECINKYKSLEVPEVLVGIQKCQLCGNIMNNEKHIDRSKLKVIDYVYKNFDIKKFLQIIDTYEEGLVNKFTDLTLKCVKEFNLKYIEYYGEYDEENKEVFLEYLSNLLMTGEFFLKLKKNFKIEKYFISVVAESTLWNEAYILNSINDKKYRLILAHYGQHNGQDEIILMSTKKKFDLDETLKELNNFNQQYHDLDKETPKSEYDLNAPDFRVCKPFKLSDTFIKAKNLEYKK